VVDVAQVQGNVLPGFAANHQMLLALRVERPAAARAWLASLIGEVTTAGEMLRARQRKARRGPWLNLGFSYLGIAKLIESQSRFNDEAFRAGLAARSSLLGDPTDLDDEGHPSRWVAGGLDTAIDVLVIVAGAEAYPVQRRCAEIRDSAVHSGLGWVWQELGSRLSREPDERNSEHFGFRDGISQPGVRGWSADPEQPLSRRLINNSRLPDGPDYAAPGTPLVWPGSFVFGYPAQNPIDARAPGPMSVAGPYWAHNGSFLVFRRLRQDVVRFAEFLRVAAAKHGLEPDALGALLIGRWRSGAPIVRTTPEGGQPPGKDNRHLGADADANNDFDFTNELPEPVFRDGHSATLHRRARVDPLGLVCPNSAHIRKVNPRAGYTEQGGLEDTLTRRILRRGIPYGPKLDDPLRADKQERDTDRGLHFLCYQTSIVDQFEFLTRMWLNSPSAPRGGGMDLLVGQRPGGPRSCYLQVGSAPPIRLETSERFVIPTGGEYLFVPSIYGLGKLADPD